MKIPVIYKDGKLIPKISLDIKENEEFEVFLYDEVENYFSIIGRDESIEDYIYAQNEVLEND